MSQQPDILQNEIARRSAQGWQIVTRGEADAQLRKPKRFSFVWAFLWFLLFGVGLIVYLLWHWAKRDELLYLRLEDGRLVVTGTRGLWAILFTPVAVYWRWAGRRHTAQTKALAYGGPIVGAVVLVIIIAAAAAAGAGGDEEDAGAVAAQPTQAVEQEGAPTVAAPGEEAEPTPAPEPTEEKLANVVSAAPGAVAEARGVQITLNEIADPWVSPATFAPDTPDPGKRFVAFDVTIQYVRESGTHFACGFGFRLTDADAFAYDMALLFDLEPSLECLDLGGGEKTRGWIAFEVNEGAALKLLKYDPDPFTTDDIEFQFP